VGDIRDPRKADEFLTVAPADDSGTTVEESSETVTAIGLGPWRVTGNTNLTDAAVVLRNTAEEDAHDVTVRVRFLDASGTVLAEREPTIALVRAITCVGRCQRGRKADGVERPGVRARSTRAVTRTALVAAVALALAGFR
jgi:hypothetical protein